MTYRDDLDALTARHTSLQLEIGRKQRELAEVGGMLVEARRLDQAESHFDRVPALHRRERRHALAGALAVTLCLGAGMGYATTAVADSRADAEPMLQGMVAKVEAVRAKHERTQRLKAEIEALRVLGLIPIVDPTAPRGKRWEKTRPMPAWTMGSPLPARGTLWPVSTASSPAGEDQR
ncbi:MAG TPA: hypothetical protein VNO30_48555 [Kofleriaceae bacterium]|nr:hypothetical protein [Kofleriaceae bacterium]